MLLLFVSVSLHISLHFDSFTFIQQNAIGLENSGINSVYCSFFFFFLKKQQQQQQQEKKLFQLVFALSAFFTNRFYILCMFYVEIMSKSRWWRKSDWSQAFSKISSILCFVLRDFNKNWFRAFLLLVFLLNLLRCVLITDKSFK